MTDRVTVAQLKKWGACADQVKSFARVFPEGATPTLVNLRRAAKAGLSLDWYAEKALSPTAWRAYQETKAQAWRAYQETTAPAWRAYQETKAQALRAYQETTAQALRNAIKQDKP